MAVITSLVAYYSLDESSGDAIDAHGTNTCTDNNTVGAATGKVAGCRDFERGNAEWFNHASNASLVTGDIDFTIAAWVQLESKGSAETIIVQKYGSGSNREYELCHDAANDRFMLVGYNGSFPLVR